MIGMLQRPWLRAAALAAAGAVLAAGGVVALAGRAVSAPKLPPVAADQLLASTARALAAQPALSGDVAAHIDLGLPRLLDGQGGVAEQINSLAGDHRLRVWTSAAGLRVADLLPAAERVLVVGRQDAWAWDSGSFTAYHLRAGTARAHQEATAPAPGSVAPDPLALARRALAAITPSTRVTVAQNLWVAGRSSYTLTLTPRTNATLVGRVEVSVDSARRLPLRVAVYARGARSPAVWSAFTRIGFGPLDPKLFRFAPPPGATVRQGGEHGTERPDASGGSASGLVPRTFGSDWSTVVAIPLPASAAERGAGPRGLDPTRLLPFSGPLFSARLAPRGDHAWLLVGMVPQPALARAEAQLS